MEKHFDWFCWILVLISCDIDRLSNISKPLNFTLHADHSRRMRKVDHNALRVRIR